MKNSRFHSAVIIVKKNWSVIWPMIIIMFMEFLVSIADIYIAGKLNKEIQASSRSSGRPAVRYYS